jgi:O-acetylhomoserine/O-acetylserine sulfhydrylase-like pyridoxal-dependent enzyme
VTAEQLTSLLAQLPMVAIMLYIFMKQTDSHQNSIKYYRDTLDRVLEWLMKQEAATEAKDERPT